MVGTHALARDRSLKVDTHGSGWVFTVQGSDSWFKTVLIIKCFSPNFDTLVTEEWGIRNLGTTWTT